MSVAPSKNPIPKKNWKEIQETLKEFNVAVKEIQIVLVDKVGDEYTAFALLYVQQ
jgi:hypothetical protein